MSFRSGHWFTKIASNPQNYEVIGQALEHFYSEHAEAQKELRPKRGDSILKASTNIAGIVEYRFGQLQELEGILKIMEIEYDKVKGERKRVFYEHYDRALSERVADQYANIEPDVLIIREFIQQVALVRNLYEGITRGLQTLHYQIGYIIKLKEAGIEDATF